MVIVTSNNVRQGRSYGTLQNRTSLVLDLPFREGTGTTASDYSGNSNVGTITNGSWSSESFGRNTIYLGNSGSATKYITITQSATINFSGDMTVMGWVKFNTMNANEKPLFIKRSGAGTQFQLDLYNNVLRWYDGSAVTSDSTNISSTGVWYHFCVTVASGTLSFYVNGALSSTGSSTITSAAVDLVIGKSPVFTSQIFDGYISDARLYSRALSLAEIKDIYNKTYRN